MYLFSSFFVFNYLFFVFIESYSGSSSTLTIVVYGRVFKTDSISSYTAGSMTAQVTSSSPNVSQSYTIYTLPSVAATALVNLVDFFVKKKKVCLIKFRMVHYQHFLLHNKILQLVFIKQYN